MLITALFMIAIIWEEPRCPSTDEWIKKLWHIYTMEYYSAIKRDATKPSEVYQKEKDKYHILCIYMEYRKNCTEEFICRAAMKKQT